MGGIAGVLVFEGSSFELSEAYLKNMHGATVHWGSGEPRLRLSADGKIGLLQTEGAGESDGAAGEGPWIACAGEIHNRAGLGSELEQAGAEPLPAGCSAAEVIRRCHARWGRRCLERFRGAYAFALWDGGTGELWLVRDPLGTKPLYYSVHHGRISFASEIKALLQDPEQHREVDELALYYYLSFLVSPAPRTLFRGIRKLPAATALRVNARGEVAELRYWEVWEDIEPAGAAAEEEVRRSIIEQLRRAVLLQGPGGRPGGVFLSGGLDSSLLTALLAREPGEPVKTFTLGYRGGGRSYDNEFTHARVVAEGQGTEHHELVLDQEELISFIPRMIYLQEEPIGDPVCGPTYYLARLAAEKGARHCLVGEGADELFWGYSSWRQLYRLERLSSLPGAAPLKGAGLRGLRALGRERTCYYEWLRRGVAGLPLYWSMEAFTELQKEDLLSPRLRRCFAGHSAWEALEPLYNLFEAGAPEKTRLNWMTFLDLNLRLPELLLMRLEKMSATTGVEARAPFLDHELVALVLGIPEKMKLGDGRPKYLLKEAARGLLPAGQIERKKQGLALPVADWFYEALGPVIRRALEKLEAQTDFFDRAEVARILERGRGQKAWYLMNFALWWQEYIG